MSQVNLKIRVAAQAADKIADDCFFLLDRWNKKASANNTIIRTGSFGYDDLEPLVIIEKAGSPADYYPHVSEDITTELIRDYLDGDNARPDLMCDLDASPLFKLQKRIVLHNCGWVDPDSINNYIAGYQGYTGLVKALKMNRNVVMEEISRAGLVSDQWAVLHAAEGDKVIVTNAVDNDPQSQTAKLLLEGDPHSVLEGTLITAYAVGASQAVILIGADNNTAQSRLHHALEQMKGCSLVGVNILDSGFDCNIEIKEITPSMPVGEDTAIIRFLEGRQALPSILSLNESSQEGLRLKAMPILVAHCENSVNVKIIFQSDYRGLAGTSLSGIDGTKVITLTGDIVHTYTVEVPCGTSFGTLIEEIGGGVSAGAAFKAVQVGGLMGAYIGSQDLSKPIISKINQDIALLKSSGSIKVIADNTCAVEMTEQLMRFLNNQSCGKCVFCREGTRQAFQIIRDFGYGVAKAEDLVLLRELCELMPQGCICSFGRNAVRPVLSSLELFQSDYEYHLKNKKCPLQTGFKEA